MYNVALLFKLYKCSHTIGGSTFKYRFIDVYCFVTVYICINLCLIYMCRWGFRVAPEPAPTGHSVQQHQHPAVQQLPQYT